MPSSSPAPMAKAILLSRAAFLRTALPGTFSALRGSFIFRAGPGRLALRTLLQVWRRSRRQACRARRGPHLRSRGLRCRSRRALRSVERRPATLVWRPSSRRALPATHHPSSVRDRGVRVNAGGLLPTATRRATYTRDNPFLAPLVDKRPLTHESPASKRCIWRSPSQTPDLKYEAGDACGVIPQNDLSLVNEILHCAEVQPAELRCSFRKAGSASLCTTPCCIICRSPASPAR